MKRISHLTILIAMLTAAVLAMPAVAQTPGSMLDNAPSGSGAPIGARDYIEVKVFQDPTLNTKITVGDDGRITMPLLGKIEVSGLTPSDLEARIKSMLEAKYINKADVTVTVLEAGSKPISVIGAVTRPGRIGITGGISLIQAITQAGGLATGYGRTLYVLRTAASGLTEQIVIDIDKRVGPKPLLQFLPGHHFAGTLQQDAQHLKGLATEFQLRAGLAQFAGPKINLEISKS